MSRGGLMAATVSVALGLSAAAVPIAHAQAPAKTVDAEGNAFTPGSLRFDPDAVSVGVGDVVRWVNTDVLVPHTATEDHGLWNLTGTYGATPANPPGFGPGEFRERPFAAGTWSYFCEVHPADMRGTVSVPVSLSDRKARSKKRGQKRIREAAAARRKKRKRFEVVAVWSHQELPADQVFDVQRRKGDRDWQTAKDGTRELSGVFKAGRRGNTWAFRVRVRGAGDRSRASGYSPEVSIVVG